MATETQANIILRLKDEFSKGLKKAGNDFNEFARSVDRVGTAISRTGMKMVAVGTTMNAPFFAAAKAMEGYSLAAQNEMKRLNNEFLSLSKVISEAAMPAIREFNNNFSKLVNVLKTIDPVLLQNFAHWSMTIGQILLAVGVIEIFVGKTLSLIGKMATGWMGKINLIIAAIAALTWAWTQHHDIVMKVLNAIDVAFNEWVVMILTGFEKIMEGLVTLSKFFPPLAGMTAPLKAGLDSLSATIAAFRQNIAQAQAGNGAFAQAVNAMGQGITNVANSVKKAADSASSHLETVMKDMQSRVLETAYTFADGFADAFDRVLFEGQSFGQSMKSLFASLGRSIVKDFVSVMGRNLFSGLLGGEGTQSGTGIGGLIAAGIGALFSGGAASYHSGGMIAPIYAHSGLSPDEVPIIAQTGEGVLSRRGMTAVGGSSALRDLNSGKKPEVAPGGVTNSPVLVIQAWDTQDIMRNRKAIEQIIINSMRNNSGVRGAMKAYA